MPRGRKKADLPGHDPDHYVVHWKGGRTAWHPDLVPSLMCWLLMLQEQNRATRAHLMGQTTKMPPAVRDGVVAQLDALDKAYTAMAAQVTERWSRRDWLGVVARVMNDLNQLPEEDSAPTAAEG